MILEKLKQVAKEFKTKYQREAVWIIDANKMGKSLVVFGVLDKELVKSMQELLLEHGFEALDWVVGLRFFKFTVRDKAE